MVRPNLLLRWSDRKALRAADADVLRQFGAIPYTIVRGQVVFLIITSRGTGRWIFPKGAPIEGLEPWEVAAHEAFEEAGVEGEMDTRPIGTFQTTKSLSLRRAAVVVDMYPLKVNRQLEDWPEKHQRHRHWVTLQEAKRLLSDTQAVEFASALSQRIVTTGYPTTARISQ